MLKRSALLATALLTVPGPAGASLSPCPRSVGGAALDQASALLENRLAAGGTNVLVSPYSLAQAVGLLATVSTGETRTTVLEALGACLIDGAAPAEVAEQADRIAEALHDDLFDLRAISGQHGLAAANAVWLHDAEVPAGIAAVLQETYYAEVEGLDFREAASAAAINDWVATATRGKIDRMVDPAGLAELAFVLANAMHFKADWLAPFDPAATAPGPFTLASGDTVEVPLMTQTGRFAHHDGEAWQVLRLPFAAGTATGPAFETVLYLPGEAETGVPDFLGLARDTVEPGRGTVTLPKLRLEDSANLLAHLDGTALEPLATGPVEVTPLVGRAMPLDQILQKVTLEFDEQGAEASAATAIAGTRSAPPDAFEFVADRPFFFMIWERDSRTPLVIGHVGDAAGAA
ncbi:MAG: serpin family protein [Azospirillaceae bacterium]